MIKAPRDGVGARGSAECSVPHVDHSAHNFALNRHHVLTDGNGQFVALLSRRTGALVHLGRDR